MTDKQRFGRVRTSLMRHLRAEYGEEVANRTLARINKRASNGALKTDIHLEKASIEKYQKSFNFTESQ